MANRNQFVPGQVYSFNVVSPILGSFKNVTVESEATARAAAGYNVDIYATHKNVFSLLPPGTPNNAAAYNYLVVRLANGAETVLGLPWIIENSVEAVSKFDAYIKLTDVPPEKEALIREMCAGNGFTIGSLEFK
jgi:hypothetical protein